ncbi:hypothetical protein J6590_066439 [Homalodisca vitripennis]|nr:hypothetical protein J6590_066439 [Homalodisca vitripennis]
MTQRTQDCGSRVLGVFGHWCRKSRERITNNDRKWPGMRQSYNCVISFRSWDHNIEALRHDSLSLSLPPSTSLPHTLSLSLLLILEDIKKAKKPSLTLYLGTNGLKVTSEPPPMAGQAGRLQGQDRSAVTHPSSSHARRCLMWLSFDNHSTRYTAKLEERLVAKSCNNGMVERLGQDRTSRTRQNRPPSFRIHGDYIDFQVSRHREYSLSSYIHSFGGVAPGRPEQGNCGRRPQNIYHSSGECYVINRSCNAAVKRWQRRWFVLYDDGELSYALDEHARTGVLIVSSSRDRTGLSLIKTAGFMTVAASYGPDLPDIGALPPWLLAPATAPRGR